MTPGAARAKAAGMSMKTALIGMLVAAVACGGKTAPDQGAKSSEMGQDGAKHEKGEKGEMANVPPSIAKFHDTLGPRWHAPQGPQRMTDTCAAIGQLQADAAAIVAAPLPSGADATAWSASGKQLTEAVAALDATCKAKDAAAFEPAFTQVHKSFHHAMEASMMHGEHGH